MKVADMIENGPGFEISAECREMIDTGFNHGVWGNAPACFGSTMPGTPSGVGYDAIKHQPGLLHLFMSDRSNTPLLPWRESPLWRGLR